MQCFLAYRAWILSGRSRKWGVYLIAAVALSLAALGVAIAFEVPYAKQRLVTGFLDQKKVRRRSVWPFPPLPFV